MGRYAAMAWRNIIVGNHGQPPATKPMRNVRHSDDFCRARTQAAGYYATLAWRSMIVESCKPNEKCKAFWSFQLRKDVGFGPLCNLGLEEHDWGTPWTATSHKTSNKRKACCGFQPRKDRDYGPLRKHVLEEHEFSLMDTRWI